MKREQKQQIINLAIEEYLFLPEKERSLTKIGRKYGIQRQTLSRHLKALGKEVINYQNKCRIDPTVFDKIDTEEKAYWLGFLYADGNISSEGYRLEVNLSVKDLNHLLKFKKFLKLETDLLVDETKCRLAVRNKTIWNNLNQKGCIPCKSLKLKFPSISIFESLDLVRHFIRGYFDGDGSIGIYRKEEISFISTNEFLIELEKYLGIKGYIRNKTSKNWPNKAFELKYSSLKARKIANLIYKDATIYLQRKYNVYKLFCLLEEESSRRKSSKIGESWDANTEVSN